MGLVLFRKYLKKRFFKQSDKEIDDQLEEFTGRTAFIVDTFLKSWLYNYKYSYTFAHWNRNIKRELNERPDN